VYSFEFAFLEQRRNSKRELLDSQDVALYGAVSSPPRTGTLLVAFDHRLSYWPGELEPCLLDAARDDLRCGEEEVR
jgi:hypothetical protein